MDESIAVIQSCPGMCYRLRQHFHRLSYQQTLPAPSQPFAPPIASHSNSRVSKRRNRRSISPAVPDQINEILMSDKAISSRSLTLAPAIEHLTMSRAWSMTSSEFVWNRTHKKCKNKMSFDQKISVDERAATSRAIEERRYFTSNALECTASSFQVDAQYSYQKLKWDTAHHRPPLDLLNFQ